MKMKLFVLFIAAAVLAVGCNQKSGQMGMKTAQNMTKEMADNKTIQKAFSNGRIKVMKEDRDGKLNLLRNNLKEQQMTMNDSQLRPYLLSLNQKINDMMVKDSKGKEQMMKSTLQIMEAINESEQRHRQLTNIQLETRNKALNDYTMRNQLLKQGMREQSMALQNPSTSGSVKKNSVQVTDAILKDSTIKTQFLQQNIEATHSIAVTPSLRSQMAESMLIIMKDPKIAKELEKMIKMAVAAQMKKMPSVPKSPSPVPDTSTPAR